MVLSNSQGETLTATAVLDTPILLSAKSTVPPLGQDPSKGETLAGLLASWPTVFNAITQLGGTGTLCPRPLFQPESAEITFTGTGQLTVSQLPNSNFGAGGYDIPPICGSDVRVEANPLTAPSLP